jgi:hypothetical protein
MLFGRDLTELASGSRALLLEILRRAVHDWVLYRTSRRLSDRMLANEAYMWLFVEQPGHPTWNVRLRCNTKFTSFVGICEMLDLEGDTVRRYVRTLTTVDLKMGRPAIYTRKQPLPTKSKYRFNVHE